MRLNDIEKAMLDGKYGKAAQWAIGYQRQVGNFFDAEEFVEVRLVRMDADRETVGESGIAFLEELAELPLSERKPRVFAAAEVQSPSAVEAVHALDR